MFKPQSSKMIREIRSL